MKQQNNTDITQQLTQDEKVALQTGVGAWHTAEVERLGVSSVTVSDGPVGLRKEQNGITVPSVCFPSIAKLACSFDPDLMREVGAAIGEQCRANDVDILLAPGVNIKRSPRCGRNFEYFSEDPYLTSELAKAYISGVNSQGVGVCVKHFAGNSQEYGRLVCDSIIDERALREIYLYAFEKIVKVSKPVSVMCAYNRLNGEYCSENKRLLTDILRNEWGFDGVVMSDWGAVNDRVKGIKAGLDLEMPQGETRKVKQALESGELEKKELDKVVERIVALSGKFDKTERSQDLEKQHILAGKLSAETTVLAKNNCKLLPLSKTDNIALIGAYAKEPALQGGGSSCVTAYKTDSLYSAMKEAGVNFKFAMGYDMYTATENMLDEARQVAEQADKVILVVGDKDCSEGIDKLSWSLSQAQLSVIDAVTSANSNVVIVLQTASGVDVSWARAAKALLIDYYGGEHGGKAIFDVIFGDVMPAGRLAETWYSTMPAHLVDYSKDYKKALHSESIFVGYRFTTTANVSVEFPFGYGLSYNEFAWSNVKLTHEKVKPTDKVSVTLDVTNKGTKADCDVVQVYATNLDTRAFTAKKNLVAFKKVRIKAGETKKVTIAVDLNNLASYDVNQSMFMVNGGNYLLTVGRHAHDDKNVLKLCVVGDNLTTDESNELAVYYNVDTSFAPTEQDFEKLCKREFEQEEKKFTISSAVCELRTSKFGKFVLKKILEHVPEAYKYIDMANPLRMYVGRVYSFEMLDTIVDILNGASKKQLLTLYKQYRKFKKSKETTVKK